MKKEVYYFFVLCMLSVFFFDAKAQDNLIILTETGTGYQNQSWFSSGRGNELQQDKIKKFWDEGKYITSAAYSSRGWFVTMARNCGYTAQRYHYGKDWPSDWILQCFNEGYYMTAVSSGIGKWFIVMSAGTGYTDQTWTFNTWSKDAEFIEEKWNAGYRITEAAKCNGIWLVVMSKNSGIGMQTYSMQSSYENLSSKAKELWNKDYSVQLIEYADGQYFMVAAQYNDGHEPQQSFNVFQGSPDDYISKQWDKGHDIAFVGGGYESPGSSSGGGSYAYDNSGNDDGIKTKTTVDPVTGIEITTTESPDGLVTITQKTPCVLCHGSGQSYIPGYSCTACMGSGYIVTTSSFYKSQGAPAGGGYANPGGSYGGYGGYGGSGGSGYGGGSSGSGSDGITCSGCGGSGRCTSCGGSGLMKGEYYYTGGDEYITNCPVCHGSGRCGVCHGTGKL